MKGMDYVKKYGLSDEDIKDIENNIDEDDKRNYIVNELRIEDILDYFKDIGIKNLKDILKYKSNIFYERLDTIKETMDKNDNIVALVNEDVFNFNIVGY